MDAFDANILNEFLLESEDLLQNLDEALLSMESDGAAADSLDVAMRALHTIKGNASFLGLTAIVTLAHAGESALEAARDDGAGLASELISALFQASESLRTSLARLQRGEELQLPDAALLDRLQTTIASRGSEKACASATATNQSIEAASDQLPDHRQALLAAALADFTTSLDAMMRALQAAERQPALCASASQDVVEICDGLLRTTAFFALPLIEESVATLKRGAIGLAATDRIAEYVAVMLPMLRWAQGQVAAVSANQEPISLPQPLRLQLDELLLRDAAAGHSDSGPIAVQRDQPVARTSPSGEIRSVRVDVGRLESLLDLVGELVLRKNSFARLLQPTGPLAGAPGDVREEVIRLSEDLDRLTADLQHATMHVRMQPLTTLLNRYPRVIRDLAAESGKEVTLEIDGAETEVDRSIIEGLGESLVHLLRNSVDHGVESPEERTAAGKPRHGLIRVRAAQSGDIAVIQVSDDGRGMDRRRLIERAIERGILNHNEAETLSDEDAFLLTFAPGFSTARQVSNISGRGVGMDVVRRSVERLGGSVQIKSTPGRGTTVTIRAPLTIAILNALIVNVGDEAYAIPLANVVKAGRINAAANQSSVPRISLAELLETPLTADHGERFEVIVEQHGRRAALLVSELAGRMEIVTKPLARRFMAAAPFSVSSIDANGDVMLVLDVARILELAAWPVSVHSDGKEGAI